MKLNTWAIDSLKIRIPLKRVKVLDSGINDMIARVSLSSGEVLEAKENTKASRDEKGIKTTFSIEQRATKFETVPYLIILVNAKQLGSRYFEGITTNNFMQLYDYLIGLKVVQFTSKELLKAECTDIDIKKDFQAEESDMKEVLSDMYKNASPSSDYDKGAKLFWQKDNKGLQFNKRESTKHTTAPFLKIYSKTSDLLSKSNIFARAYLENIPPNLWRLEYTIKNKKHLERFDIGNTFVDLLSLSQDKMQEVNDSSLKAILEKRTRDVLRDVSEIPPRDLLLVNGLIWLLDSGNQWTVIKSNLIGSLKGANKSRKLKYLDGLYLDYIKPIEGYSKHQNIDTIFNQIGYNF